jgi:hypothetical protein
MIPTAFLAASAIYSKIDDQPANEFLCYPNASRSFGRFRFNNVHSSGRDKYAPPAGGHLTRCTCRRVAGRCKDATLFRRGHKRMRGATWK